MSIQNVRLGSALGVWKIDERKIDVEKLARYLMENYDDDYCWDNSCKDAKRKRKFWISQAENIASNAKSWIVKRNNGEE